MSTLDTLNAVTQRLKAYASAPIPTEVDSADVMLSDASARALDHYMGVGRSAIEVIAHAMILANKPSFGSILDLPSGGGRVARHLAAFLPEAELFVSELDEGLQAFAAAISGATAFHAPLNFGEPPSRTFDLVFVGSLVTHLDAPMFRNAARWFIDALAPEGILVLTTSGRRHDFVEREILKNVAPVEWQRVTSAVAATGFGFTQIDELGGTPYGFSWSAPSWLMSFAEANVDTRIVGFQEAAWDDHQDVLMLQRRRLDVPLR